MSTNASVAEMSISEDTEILTYNHCVEISLLSDFPEDAISIEEEGCTNIINEILRDEEIEIDVNFCMEDLIKKCRECCATYCFNDKI